MVADDPRRGDLPGGREISSGLRVPADGNLRGSDEDVVIARVVAVGRRCERVRVVPGNARAVSGDRSGVLVEGRASGQRALSPEKCDRRSAQPGVEVADQDRGKGRGRVSSRPDELIDDEPVPAPNGGSRMLPCSSRSATATTAAAEPTHLRTTGAIALGGQRADSI